MEFAVWTATVPGADDAVTITVTGPLAHVTAGDDFENLTEHSP